ncbi:MULTISPECIES: pyridoxal-phosphate dependent enzyme [unclassified Streptomyces]|uniref:pyridoxal-phosphate dependent enzyme n=1 Tax=unclassified Streptomyces TaxID=2593676 RepID=UPI0025B2AA21|nr:MULTISPECIES: pyridoxal-phosphate dependent enzyme [unclassified Streptomyces]MDN3244567.1 pyridoxal-phosphate dependent enzyme [Streptomyces sp. ZSW22]MDN3253662.1 pyridoxal-phosphate dependent enzyme [Streptomyces sp. MA25(2023)]
MDGHISEAIGRPDLIRLDDSLVCLRFETMKVVSALAAVRHLLDTGTVRRGDTLIDSSSGIYAYALALACHRYGMHCHIVGSTTVDHTLRTQLDVLGAHLEQMQPSTDLKLDQSRRVARVREILREHPDYHWMRQYHDDVHYLGYEAVAERIQEETGAGSLTLVGGVGSGASTGALAHYLRKRSVDVRLVGVQPFGSVTFGSDHVADPEIIIAGIGSSIPFGNVRHDLYDTVHWLAFDAALAGSVDLLRRHAVFAGLSSGAAYLAARWERGEEPQRTAVFIAADTGHRYVDTVFVRHTEAARVEDLAPRQVSGTDELALPWSRLNWNGSPAPGAAVLR